MKFEDVNLALNKYIGYEFFPQHVVGRCEVKASHWNTKPNLKPMNVAHLDGMKSQGTKNGYKG